MQSFEQMIAKISTNLDRKLPGTSAHKNSNLIIQVRKI